MNYLPKVFISCLIRQRVAGLFKLFNTTIAMLNLNFISSNSEVVSMYGIKGDNIIINALPKGEVHLQLLYTGMETISESGEGRE